MLLRMGGRVPRHCLCSPCRSSDSCFSQNTFSSHRAMAIVLQRTSQQRACAGFSPDFPCSAQRATRLRVSFLCGRGKKRRPHCPWGQHDRFSRAQIRIMPPGGPISSLDLRRYSGLRIGERRTPAPAVQPSQVPPVTGSLHKRHAPALTATGKAPDSHRIP